MTKTKQIKETLDRAYDERVAGVSLEDASNFELPACSKSLVYRVAKENGYTVRFKTGSFALLREEFGYFED